MDLWLDLGHLVREFVSTKISFQGVISDDNYQIQNVQNEQIVLDELNEAHVNQTVENSEDILNAHKNEGETDLENFNYSSVEQTDDKQLGSSDIYPNNEALIDEANQNILNENDDDEILYSDPFEHLPYFHGEISREEAERRLRGVLKGTFLTRYI